MSKYEVVQDFKDLQDGGKVYLKGEAFPRPSNKAVSEERLNRLLSKDNNQSRAVIKEVKLKKEKKTK